MSRMSKYGQERAKNKRFIQMQLDAAGINGAIIAKRAGVSSQAVSGTLNGHNHSPKVLDELRKAGVEERFLYDPRKNQAV